MEFRRFAAVLTAGCVAAACGGGGGGGDAAQDRGALLEAAAPVATLSAGEVDAMTAASGLQAMTGRARCGVKLMGLHYRTAGVRDEPATASGVLLLPDGPACAGPATLLAWGKGTDVVRGRTLAAAADVETRFLAAMYAAHGYAVVASDLLGFARSDYAFHPYLHAQTEAAATIDALRAARHASRAQGLPLNGRVMLAGYSQGAHTSMATQQAIERDFAGEFDLAAAAHLAGPYHLSAVIRQDLPVAGAQVTLPYMITSYQKTYGDLYREPADIYNPPYADYIEQLLPSATLDLAGLVASGKLPVGTPEAIKTALLRPAFRADLRSNPDNALVRAAASNDLVGWTPKAPMLLCGGSGDPTIPLAVHQSAAWESFKARGYAGATFMDVDPQVQALFGPGGKAPAPGDPAFAAYVAAYHTQYAGAICHPAARQYLDRWNAG